MITLVREWHEPLPHDHDSLTLIVERSVGMLFDATSESWVSQSTPP